MNTIKRDVYVLRNTIKIPIEVTKGTDAISFEFTIRDYNLPATAAAVAYAYRMGMKKPNSTLCDVSGNVISFQPSANFFEVGMNELQIRVINEDKSLISFKEKVKCSDSIGFPDDEEEKQKTLVEQLVAYTGKETADRKAADESEKQERTEVDKTEKAERMAADATEKAERQEEIKVERERINNLTKLGEGSTTGDAELQDIRVGVDGTVYETAGEAVREQVGKIKEDVTTLKVTPQVKWMAKKYINGTNGLVDSVEGYDLAIISLNNINHVKAECCFANYAGYAFLTEKKDYICGSNNDIVATYDFKLDVEVPNDARYLYVSHNNRRGAEFKIKCIRSVSAVDEIRSNTIYITPDLTDGKGILYNNGEYFEANSYSYCDIDVEEASCISGTCYFANDFGYAFYDSNGDYMCGEKNNIVNTYIYNLDVNIPIGAKTIKISHRNDRGVELCLELKYDGMLSDVKNIKRRVLKLETKSITKSNNVETISAEKLDAVNTISIDAPNTKSGNIITFFAKIKDMSTVRVGHGQNTYSSSFVRVRNNLLEVHRKDKEDVLVQSYTTNLVFEKFINIIITTNSDNTANIQVSSENGTYTVNNIEWIGCSGTVYAMAVSGTYTDCKLSYYCKDVSKPVWFFGDSYMSMWNVYASEFGAKNFLNDSYPGRNSSKEQAIASLNKIIQKGRPRIIVWALGMNDQEKVSWGLSQWQTGYDTVKKVCETNNIELILVTIPNTPTMINVNKNEMIKSSGYRYVDIAELVGASEKNSPWYDGLLSGDNVHPTELGRKLIAMKFISDIPKMV